MPKSEIMYISVKLANENEEEKKKKIHATTMGF